MNIKLENIFFTYNNNNYSAPVLNNISLDIKCGEFVGIVGPSGAGKTTLLELISGFLKPFSGKVLLDGNDIYSTKNTEYRKKISMVFQFPEKQIFADTVSEDVSFGPRNHGITGEKLEKLVRKSIEFVGLEYENLNWKSPFDLSAGEQRRIAIAGILALEPQVILLDEPTIAVDYIGLKCIEKIMNSIYSEGKTVVLVSHDIDLIAKNVVRVIALSEGKIVFDGEKGDFFNNDDLISSLNLEMPNIVKFIRKYNLEHIENIYDFDRIKDELKKAKLSIDKILENKLKND